MATLIIPVAKADDTDVGIVAAVTAAQATQALVGGAYKIAAMGTNLLWKLGANAVDATKGSYLADGDQEVIFVPAGGDTLRFIRSANTTVDGEINIVPVQLFDVPGRDARPYLT